MGCITVSMVKGGNTQKAGKMEDGNDILKTLDSIKKGQENIVSRLESKIEKFKNDMTKMFDMRMKELKEEIYSDMGVITKRLEAVELSVKKAMEEGNIPILPSTSEPSHDKCACKEPFDPKCTVVIMGLKEKPGEDLQAIVDGLILNGLKITNISPIAVLRTKSREGKSGIIKAEFDTLENKITILRAKLKLKEHRAYQHVYMRSSKSHVERLIELNTKTLLTELEKEDEFTFTGSGRLVKRKPKVSSDKEVFDPNFKRTRSMTSSTSSRANSPLTKQTRFEDDSSPTRESEENMPSGGARRKQLDMNTPRSSTRDDASDPTRDVDDDDA